MSILNASSLRDIVRPGIRLKVTFVCEGFKKSSIIEQPWRHIYEISQRMISMGNSVSIITNGFPRLPRDEEIDGIPIHRIRKGLLLGFNSKELLENLSTSDADIINWHSGLLSAIYLLRFRNLLEKNLIWTVYLGKVSFRDMNYLKFSDIFSMYRFRLFLLYSLFPDLITRLGANVRQINKIITLNARLKNCLVEMGVPSEKIVVIPSGVDVNKFNQSLIPNKDEIKKSMNIPRDNLLILFFGSPSTFRGVDNVIRAMPLIQKEIPSAELLILARPSPHRLSSKEIKKVKKMATKYRAVKVLESLQSQNALIRFLAISDVVTLPFRFWPNTECPLSILEAMAMQKPIVASFQGGIPWIITQGETGILVNPKSPPEIANGVITLLKRKNLAKKLGENARKYVQEHHNWEVIVQQTLSVFKESHETVFPNNKGDLD